LRNLKSVRTSSFPAPGFAVVRQHLRGAADAAPKGFIERDAAKPPAVRPAGPVDLPLRGPSKVPIIPDQASKVPKGKRESDSSGTGGGGLWSPLLRTVKAVPSTKVTGGF
jgi:hypothetical protein